MTERNGTTPEVNAQKRWKVYVFIVLAVLALAVVYFVSRHYKRHEDKKPLPTQTMTKPEQQPAY